MQEGTAHTWWRFTHLGLQSVSVTRCLKAPTAALRCRRTDADYEDYTLFELWDTLRAGEWVFRVVPRGHRRRTLPKYSAGSDKILHIRHNAKTLPRWSMLAHWRASVGALEGELPALEKKLVYYYSLFPERHRERSQRVCAVRARLCV